MKVRLRVGQSEGAACGVNTNVVPPSVSDVTCSGCQTTIHRFDAEPRDCPRGRIIRPAM
jgi:hypothetical protein